MKSVVVATLVGLLFAAVAGRGLQQLTVTSSAFSTSGGSGDASASASAASSTSPSPVQASEAASLTEPPSPPLLDVYFLVDLTETSTSFIEELANDASLLVDGSLAVTETVYLGVGTYQDTPDASSFTHLVNVSGALNATESVLSRCDSDERHHASDTCASL